MRKSTQIEGRTERTVRRTKRSGTADQTNGPADQRNGLPDLLFRPPFDLESSNIEKYSNMKMYSNIEKSIEK